eukprot:6153505-Lingulodinium_polyedra.AAC.1
MASPASWRANILPCMSPCANGPNNHAINLEASYCMKDHEDKQSRMILSCKALGDNVPDNPL